MKLRINETSQIRPQARRKPTMAPYEASDRCSDWSDSSTDLRLGLEVVEIPADTHWADTQAMSAFPPGE